MIINRAPQEKNVKIRKKNVGGKIDQVQKVARGEVGGGGDWLSFSFN